MIDDILRSQVSGDGTVLITLDFSKAFDMISHDVLISKARYMGSSTSACKMSAGLFS